MCLLQSSWGFFVRLLIFHTMKLRNNWEVTQEIILFPFFSFHFPQAIFYYCFSFFSFQCKHLIFREMSYFLPLQKFISNYKPQSNITVLLPSPDDIWETGKFIHFVGQIILSWHKLIKKKKKDKMQYPHNPTVLQLISLWNQNSSINYIARDSDAYYSIGSRVFFC